MQYTSPTYCPEGSNNTSTGAFELTAWDMPTLADLKAVKRKLASPGRVEAVRALNGRTFRYDPNCVLDADDQLVVIPDDGNKDVTTSLSANLAGRWLACAGQVVDLALAISKDTADGATLYTMPTGAALLVQGPGGYWEVTTGFTGGSSSTIGLSSDQSGHTTAGDLLGGSGGDATAKLGTVGDYIEPTIGADVAAGIILKGGKLIKFNRITSAFTAGEGYAHVVGTLLANPGA